MPLAFHIENFGCRAARADGEAVASGLAHLGLAPSPAPQADVVIVNTCSVTAEADREARAYIRRAHRLNPEARIVVTGCYAQRAPEELAGIPGVAAVIGNSHKALAPEIATRLAAGAPRPETSGQLVPLHTLAGTAIYADDRFAHSFLEESQVLPGSQTRPNLKIQEGCSNRCTFCVIPYTRGNSRSLPEDKVLAQVRGFVAAAGNELVLSGINLGRWGRDLPSSGPRPSLAQLVRRIFAETALPRLRLSSIEPMDWDHALIALMREFGGARLARHAHLPLQSGSDAVLRRMHRRYRPWHYAEKGPRPPRSRRPGSHPRRRRHGWLPRRDRPRIRRDNSVHQATPLRLPASIPFFPSSRHARMGTAQAVARAAPGGRRTYGLPARARSPEAARPSSVIYRTDNGVRYAPHF